MDEEQFEGYPHLGCAWAAKKHEVSLKDTAFARMFDAESEAGVMLETKEVDDHLRVLYESDRDNTQLWEQVDDLFGTKRKTLAKALTEMAGLSRLTSLGILQEIGWPQDYGGNPPLDGRLLLGEYPIPFDIKTASTSGIQELEERVMSVVEDWCQKHGLREPATEYKFHGPLALQVLGSELQPVVVEHLQSELEKLDNWPSDPIHISLKDTRFIDITIRESTGCRVSSGMFASDDLRSALAETLINHIRKKSELVAESGESGFFLLYIRLPMSGDVDAKPEVFHDALLDVYHEMQQEPAFRRLYGVAYFDWTHSDRPATYCCPNESAQWPDGCDERKWRESLKSRDWP